MIVADFANSWQEKPRRPVLTEEEFPNLAALQERWQEDEAELRTYLATLMDTDLDRMLTHTSPGRGFNYTALEFPDSSRQPWDTTSQRSGADAHRVRALAG